MYTIISNHKFILIGAAVAGAIHKKLDFVSGTGRLG
jgi:hypothetical protein